MPNVWGHTLIEPFPAIVQLKLQYPNMRALSSIKSQGQAHILVKGKVIGSEQGEIAFTDYGITGPPILQLSRKAAYHLARGEQVKLSVDLMPGRTEEELVDFFRKALGDLWAPDRGGFPRGYLQQEACYCPA
ncbi:hypothetical protein ACFTAO_49055 [Paenibacillus rhizoplanae]